MRIVLWIGKAANQKALANKIAKQYSVMGIIAESKSQKKKFTLRLILEKVFERVFLSTISNTWWGMMNYYEKKYPEYPDAKFLEVSNINSEAAFDFTKELAPDLILVSGTRLVKEKMLSIKPKLGILNLHTGISPYVKGGPNCTNWCISTKQFHLIGNTIMWIDLGIDSGNILTTEFTEIKGDESYYELQLKVMEHAHQLYQKAVKFLKEGHMSNVAQSEIGNGKTYFTKQWTLTQKIKMVRNYSRLNKEMQSGKFVQERSKVRTVNI